MAEKLQILGGPDIPLAEIEIRTSRSSGPGGQHANVTESRVEASFDVVASSALDERSRALLLERLGERVAASAQDARSQARNRELALERLGAKISKALERRKPRRPTRPTRSSRERRLRGKRRRSEVKRTRRRPGAGEE